MTPGLFVLSVALKIFKDPKNHQSSLTRVTHYEFYHTSVLVLIRMR